MRIAVIINPFAGRGRRGPLGRDRARQADAMTRRAGIDAEIRVTEGPGHGAELSREYAEAGVDLVVAWGGDGTVNEIAGPLIGTATALAIVPAGSGDGMARGLGIRGGTREAFARALSDRRAALDVGYLGSRHFLNIAGLGFDARVAAGFGRSGRYGSISYAAEAFTALWSYQSASCQLAIDGGRASEAPRFVVAFANSGQYGNGLVLAPDADPFDGWLNAVIVDGGSPWRQLWRARRLFFNRLGPAEGIRRTRVRHVSVSADAVAAHVDGEPFEASGTFDIRVEPGALKIVPGGP